jgi:tetratricopeptide (TPR) repeat protein
MSKKLDFKFYTWAVLFLLLNGILFSSCNEAIQYADTPIVDQNVLVDSLIKEGKQNYYKGDYLNAQKNYQEAQRSINSFVDTILIMSLLLHETELLKLQGEYTVCIPNYYKVAKLADLVQDTYRLALANYNLAAVHYHLEQIEEAQKYNLKAQDGFWSIGKEAKLINCYVQSAALRRAEGNIESAKEYLELAVDYYAENGDTTNLSICYNNLGNILFEEKKYHRAISLYKQAAQFSILKNQPYGLAIRLGNISEMYLKLSALEEAKYYLDSSMNVATEIEAKETILLNYRRLVDYYYYKEELDSVLSYGKKILELNTTLLQFESKGIIQVLEKKHKNELELIHVHSELDISEENARLAKQAKTLSYWLLFFVLIIASIIIVTTRLLYQKQKTIRLQDAQIYQKEKKFLEAENKLATLEIQHKAEEQKLLKNELHFKKKELIKFSLNLKEKTNLVEEIKQLLDQIKFNQIPDSKTIKKINLLLQYSTNDHQLEIEKRIEEINSSFFYKLKTAFPKLSPDDIRLAALLFLNLSSKEIANIINIEPKSVDMKRYRLKKKMNLDSKADLKEFLILFSLLIISSLCFL